jgi:hypothetical protein
MERDESAFEREADVRALQDRQAPRRRAGDLQPQSEA